MYRCCNDETKYSNKNAKKFKFDCPVCGCALDKIEEPTAEEILDYLVNKCRALNKNDIKVVIKALKGE